MSAVGLSSAMYPRVARVGNPQAAQKVQRTSESAMHPGEEGSDGDGGAVIVGCRVNVDDGCGGDAGQPLGNVPLHQRQVGAQPVHDAAQNPGNRTPTS